jgi:DNA replicative helicase MCM subunit Mcm2 (Cdc46/Mcm family)
MDNLTKVKINLKAGTIELEGSEEFVQKNLDAFKGFLFKSKKFDTNIEKGIENIDHSHSQRDRIKEFRSIISELQKGKEFATIQDIISKAEESGFNEEIVENFMEKLRSAGEIIEIAPGHFRVFF